MPRLPSPAVRSAGCRCSLPPPLLLRLWLWAVRGAEGSPWEEPSWLLRRLGVDAPAVREGAAAQHWTLREEVEEAHPPQEVQEE